MRKAFSLIEVVISVIIVVSVGIALLHISSNSTKIISYSQKKFSTGSYFSSILLNKNDICDDTKTNFYDALKNSFKIEDRKLISLLREQSFICKIEEDKTIDLSEEENNKNYNANFAISRLFFSKQDSGNIDGYIVKELRWKKTLLRYLRLLYLSLFFR